MTSVYRISYPIGWAGLLSYTNRYVVPTLYQSSVTVESLILDKLKYGPGVFAQSTVNSNATDVFIPEISSRDLYVELLSLKHKREMFKIKNNTETWDWNVTSRLIGPFNLETFITNLLIEAGCKKFYYKKFDYLVPTVTGLYDSIPPESLKCYPLLSDIFFCLFDLLNEESHPMEIACYLHKAAFYSKYPLFNSANIRTSVLDVISDDKRMRNHGFFNDRCHSEYFASRLDAPLVLVKRGTIIRLVKELLSAVQFDIVCGRSSRVLTGWKKFISLQCKRLIFHPSQFADDKEKIEENDRETKTGFMFDNYMTVFTPTTHVLFKNTILKAIADCLDKKGSMNSEVGSQFAFDISYAFGCGYTSSIFIPPSEFITQTCKTVMNPFMSSEMYHANALFMVVDVCDTIIPPRVVPRMEDVSNDVRNKFLVTLPIESPVYNKNSNFGDTVTLDCRNFPWEISSGLKKKNKIEIPVFFTMLLKELETILLYCQLVGGLSPQHLISSPEEEIICTPHHLSYTFLCNNIEKKCFDIYQNMFRNSLSYKHFLDEHGNDYWNIIPIQFRAGNEEDIGSSDWEMDYDAFTYIDVHESEVKSSKEWNGPKSRSTVCNLVDCYKNKTKSIDLRKKLFTLYQK